MSTTELHHLSVAELAAQLKNKHVSAVEAAQHFLARAQAHQNLGAFVAIDEATTLAQARAADALIALPPRERVLDLMRLAASGAGCDRPLRPADLARVLSSFDGEVLPVPEMLARLFPGAVIAGG